MPGPLVQPLPVPDWLKPGAKSVFDPWYVGPLRALVSRLGLDDPTQVMNVGMPLEMGPGTGGVVDALAQQFPRLAKALRYQSASDLYSRVDQAVAKLPAQAAPPLLDAPPLVGRDLGDVHDRLITAPSPVYLDEQGVPLSVGVP